jgi:hypothetical protein
MLKEVLIDVLIMMMLMLLDSDALTAAILFLENERDKSKVDAKVEVTGVAFNIRKGA